MVASSNEHPIPAGVTAGQFAQVVGVTERVVAGRKADGRLPKLASGAIDLHAVIRAGVVELARRRGSNEPPGLDPADAYDAALRMGAGFGVSLTLMAARGAPSMDGLDDQAEALIQQVCDLFQIPRWTPEK